MRLLLVHADRFEYEAREKAVKEPEPLDESHKRGALENGLVVFSTVEKNDEQEPEQIATNAASSIEEVLRWLKTKKGLTGREPHFLDYARRFGIEWESFADVGQMRFGPESNLIMDLLAEYAGQVIRRIGIPILNVKGTNMFDIAVKPIKEHLQLFGSRAYEVKVDERTFVLRYAACFQQFSMVKDWTLSYRTLPFGTFEVADSYRMEQSGELLLSFRLRKFLMPDLHIYLTNLNAAIQVGAKVHERIYEENRKIHREYVSLYNTTRSFFEANKDAFMELVKVEKKPILLK